MIATASAIDIAEIAEPTAFYADPTGQYPYVHPQPTSDSHTTDDAPAPALVLDEVAYRFRRADHAAARAATLDTLYRHYRHRDRANRLAACGTGATVWHSPSTDQIVVRANHCGMRCCPRCREIHSARTRDTLNRFLANVDRTRLSMITFTLRHSDTPLSEQIDRLYASFKSLRKLPLWQSAHPKGYCVLEVKRAADGLCWHPHLHLLAETPYISHAKLSAAWLAVTGDSTIVDIRRVNAKAVDQHRDYLCAYLCKPAAADILADPDTLVEWIDAFLHRRVLIKFGKPTLADKPLPPTQPEDYRLIGSLLGIMHAHRRGDRTATAWLIRIGRGPTTEGNDQDAGKDYSIDPAYQDADTTQFF